jgi:hypothetical protein
MAAGRRARVAGELDEIEVVVDRDRAREVGEEEQARLQRSDQERLAREEVGGQLATELGDASPDLRCGEVDVSDVLVAGDQEASSRWYRWARRSMSRL